MYDDKPWWYASMSLKQNKMVPRGHFIYMHSLRNYRKIGRKLQCVGSKILSMLKTDEDLKLQNSLVFLQLNKLFAAIFNEYLYNK